MKQRVPCVHEPKCEIQTTTPYAQPHLIVKLIHNVKLIFSVTTTLCKDPKYKNNCDIKIKIGDGESNLCTYLCCLMGFLNPWWFSCVQGMSSRHQLRIEGHWAKKNACAKTTESNFCRYTVITLQHPSTKFSKFVFLIFIIYVFAISKQCIVSQYSAFDQLWLICVLPWVLLSFVYNYS